MIMAQVAQSFTLLSLNYQSLNHRQHILVDKASFKSFTKKLNGGSVGNTLYFETKLECFDTPLARNYFSFVCSTLLLPLGLNLVGPQGDCVV